MKQSQLRALALGLLLVVLGFVAFFTLSMSPRESIYRNKQDLFSHETAQKWWETDQTNRPKQPLLLRDSKKANLKNEKTIIQYDNLDPGSDQEWINAMKYGEILAIEPDFISGSSEKYPIILQYLNQKSGIKKMYRAVAKPVTNLRSVFWPTETVEIVDYNLQTAPFPRKVGVTEQGVMEITAFFCDRLLGLNRKPPAVGRFLMPEEFQLARSIHLSINKERKKEEQRDEEEQRDVDEEEQEEKHQRHVVLDDVLAPHRKRMLDRFELLDFWGGAAVSIHSWVRSVTPSWPDQTIGGYLKDPVAFSTKLRENSTLLSQLATFSDTIVFDFLVDDHDRNGPQNWLVLNEKIMMIWDSGLAWRHGPVGVYEGSKYNCQLILCGLEKWKNQRHDPNCLKICLFNQTTIKTLKSMGGSAEREKQLGFLLDQLLQGDPLYPHFESQLYYSRSIETSPVVKYKQENFLWGFNAKIEVLLDHVDSCERVFGSDTIYV